MPSKKSELTEGRESCFAKARAESHEDKKGTPHEDRKKSRQKRHKNLQKARKKEVQDAFRCLVEFIATIVPRNPHDGTSGDDLDKVCRMQFGDRFKGVFAADTHPKDMSDGFYIINTDKFAMPGTHWTAVAGVPPDICFYDSFDRKSTTLFPEVVLPATGNSPNVRQRIKESNCGERCVAFLTCVAEFGIPACKKFL